MATSFLLIGLVAVTYVFSLQIPGSTNQDLARSKEDAHLSVYNVNQAYSTTYQNFGNKARPRMLVVRGCSGSSAIMQLIRPLLRFHGIPVPTAESPHWDKHGNPVAPSRMSTGWPAELLKKNVNWFYKDGIRSMPEAIEMANEEVLAQNQTLIFKAMLQDINTDNEDAWDELRQKFWKMGVVAALNYRQNMLDQMICQVKDCFQEDYGYPVDTKTRKRSSLCFERREVEGKSIAAQHAETMLAKRKTPLPMNLSSISAQNIIARSGYLYSQSSGMKAFLNITNLVYGLRHEFHMLEKARQRLQESGFRFKEVTEEDLLDFQTDMPGALERSVLAWEQLLESLSVTPQRFIIREFLSAYANTFPRQPSHKKLIYNYREVKEALQGTLYESFLRGS